MIISCLSTSRHRLPVALTLPLAARGSIHRLDDCHGRFPEGVPDGLLPQMSEARCGAMTETQLPARQRSARHPIG
jgi:hypothetical protein